MVGGRYVRFDDEFNVSALGGIFGPERSGTPRRGTGLRVLKSASAITSSSAAWPFHRGPLHGRHQQPGHPPVRDHRQQFELITLAACAPPSFATPRRSFASSDHQTEFTPLVEFRVEGHVQLTRLISFKVGWTGIFMDSIARAADMVNYTVPTMGINTDSNQQTVFMQGVNVGVELNR